jgi:hypothetical protein
MSQEKVYKVIDKFAEIGEKTGLTVNRKVTLFGKIVAAIVTILIFGTAALIGAFIRGATKK